MRQLHACDFCGGDPTGVYEVFPESLSPTEDEQRRVALCADCRDTLESVLTPLLARLDGSAPKPAASPSPEPDSVTESAPEPTPDSGATPSAEPDDAPDEEPAADERAAVREEVRRTAPRADRPPGYAKVLRVLQNREDPMARHDLAALATNAYGLDEAEFDAVVDAAVENGDLEESRAGLKTI